MIRRCLMITCLIFSLLILTYPALAREWTVMVYIGADNNLTDYVNGDVDEMESAGSTEDVAILCQIDGLTGSWYYGYDDYLGDNWSTVRRYCIQAGITSDERINGGFISDLGELNSEDPDVLRDFVNWGADNYPANRYMLIIWNHGGGWARPAPIEPYKAIVWDDTDGSGGGIGFSNGEYAGALAGMRDHIGYSLSIVGFDACIVGLLEAEYETMGYGDYLVHSEANIPGDGWDYEFLQDMVAAPYASEEQIVYWIVNEYAGEYGSSVTLSGLRLDHDHVDFQMALNDFARELILQNGMSNSSITSAVSGARDFGSSLVDVYDFADEIDSRNIGGAGSALDLAAQALKTALGYPPAVPGKPLVVTYETGYSGARGVMAYTPTGGASASWNNLDIAECNIWKELINGSTSLPTTKLAYWGNTLGKYIETGSAVDLYVKARNLGGGTASSVTATLSSCDSRVTIPGGAVSFGNIGAGAINTATTAFNVTISPAVGESTFIPFEITFNTGYTAKFILTALGEINFPPTMTELVSPFDYARVTDGTPILTWLVPDDSESDPLHFDVQWDTDPNFTSAVTVASDLSGVGFGPSVPRLPGSGNCSYTVNSQGEGAMIAGLTYWWRVRAKDEFHSGPWSLTRSITIETSLTDYDWHQTTDAQFLCDDITDLGVEGNKVFLQGAVTVIDDDMEYASEAAAWAVWSTYDGGSSIEVTLENRRQVSGIYSLRIRDRNTSAYGGAWRIIDPATVGVARAWAKIYDPGLGDMAEFLGLHDGTDYSSSFTTGLIVYCKADTLKYWDGSGHVIHTSMDSLWHYYEIEFDLDGGFTDLYIDDVHRGTFTDNGLIQITMLAVGSKLLGNAAKGTGYWDDFEVIVSHDSDSGTIIGQPVAYAWRPPGTESWGFARWTQNAGDSIRVTVQYRDGGGSWTDYASSFATGTEGSINITDLATSDSVRLKAVLYKPPSGPLPALYDWTVDWSDGSVNAENYTGKPEHLVLYRNWPNPFNAITGITYETPESGPVNIAIYNVKGERVYYEESYRVAGMHYFRFDASDLSSGTYFCRINAAGETADRKMLLLK